jgi:regulatory protein
MHSAHPDSRAERGTSKEGGKRMERPEISLRARALQYLARREYSRVELHAKLLRHLKSDVEFGQAQTVSLDAMLDDFTARGWLSDARAAAQMVSAKRSRYGMQRISHELRERGISESLINDSLPQLKETELEAAREVWLKKFGTAPLDENEKAKQVRFLQSRGFAMDVVFKVLRGLESEG